MRPKLHVDVDGDARRNNSFLLLLLLLLLHVDVDVHSSPFRSLFEKKVERERKAKKSNKDRERVMKRVDTMSTDAAATRNIIPPDRSNIHRVKRSPLFLSFPSSFPYFVVVVVVVVFFPDLFKVSFISFSFLDSNVVGVIHFSALVRV